MLTFDLITNIIMIFGTFVFIVWNIIKKKYLEALSYFFVIPLFLFWHFCVLLGGTPNNNAKELYEFYEEGHYYLCSHNVYTEVTEAQYNFMEILLICFSVSIVLFGLTRFIIEIKKHKNKK